MNKLSTLLQYILTSWNIRMYVYDPDDADQQAAIAEAVEAAIKPLKVKTTELLGKLRKAQAGGEVDPDAHAALETERDELKAQNTALAKQVKTLGTTVEEAKTALATEQSFSHKALIDTGLTEALTAAGVAPKYMKAAAALLKSSGEVKVVAEGETRSVTVGGKPMADAVKAWAAGDDGKEFVVAPANGGTGGVGKQAPGKPAPGANGGKEAAKPNFAGTKEERTAAIAERFPGLAQAGS